MTIGFIVSQKFLREIGKVEIGGFLGDRLRPPIAGSGHRTSPQSPAFRDQEVELAFGGANQKHRGSALIRRSSGEQTIAGRHPARCCNRRLFDAAFEQMAVSDPRHPSGAREMALVNVPGASRLTARIDTEDDANNLAPVRALCIGLEKTKIGDEMPLVIAAYPLGLRWRIVEQGDGHIVRSGLEAGFPLPRYRGAVIRSRAYAVSCANPVMMRANDLAAATLTAQSSPFSKRNVPRSARFAEEFHRIDIEDRGDLLEHIDGRSVFFTLQHPNIVAVDTGTVRKFLLRQAFGMTHLTQVGGDDLPQAHAGDVAALPNS